MLRLSIQKLSTKLNIKALQRCYSASSFKLLNIEDSNKGYSILEMNKKPVNSLSLEFLEELNDAFQMLEEEKSCRGVIITSKLPVFSAGLDLLEMHNPNPDRLEKFWKSFQDLKLRLFGSSMVLISAINGACPAGGCAIAFSCDYRILANGKHKMGLNETQIGLAAPYWLCESMKLLTGHREAERLLSLGLMLNPAEALEKGLVDKVVTSDQLMAQSVEEMEKLLRIADIGRIQTKLQLRKYFIEEFHQRRNEDMQIFLAGIQNPKLQALLGMYLENLKQKK